MNLSPWNELSISIIFLFNFDFHTFLTLPSVICPDTIEVVFPVGNNSELTGTVGKLGRLCCCFWDWGGGGGGGGPGDTGAWNKDASPCGGQAASSLSNPLISKSSAVLRKSCKSCCGTNTSPV